MSTRAFVDIAAGSVWIRRTDGAVVLVQAATATEVHLHQPKQARSWRLPKATFLDRYAPAPKHPQVGAR